MSSVGVVVQNEDKRLETVHASICIDFQNSFMRKRDHCQQIFTSQLGDRQHEYYHNNYKCMVCD